MSRRLIRLRYAGNCSLCSASLSARSKAWWDGANKTIVCLTCRPEESADEPVDDRSRDNGIAGESAHAEYLRRHLRREQRIDQRFGRFAAVVKFLSEDPQSIRAWAKGSDGERRLAEQLVKAIGTRAVFLNDRKVPGTRGNIDHLAVAASGVWVIDSKNYVGLVERRDKGGWLRTDYHLYVGGRDRSKLVDGLAWQVAAVEKALSGAAIPVSAALCFADAEWRLFSKPFQHNGVWVVWVKKLAEMISGAGTLSEVEVAHIADRLASALPAAA